MASRRAPNLEAQVQKLKTDLSALGTELAAIKSKNNNKDEPEDKSASEKEDDHLEVTPEVSTGGILGLRDITEENIFTVSGDSPELANTGSAPTGEADNLKSKQVRPWWKKSKSQPSSHPPPTPMLPQDQDPAPTQLRTQLEQWHNTLCDLSKTSQNLEDKITTTMLNWVKDLELRMQQKIQEDLSGATTSLMTSEEVATLTKMAAQYNNANTIHSITIKKLETDVQVLQEKVDVPETVSTSSKRNFDALMTSMKSLDTVYESAFLGIDTRLTQLEDKYDTLEKGHKTDMAKVISDKTKDDIKHLQTCVTGVRSDIESLDKKFKSINIWSITTDL